MGITGQSTPSPAMDARGWSFLFPSQTTSDAASSVCIDVLLAAEHREERDEPPEVYVERDGELLHADPDARRKLANDAVAKFEGLDVGGLAATAGTPMLTDGSRGTVFLPDVWRTPARSLHKNAKVAFFSLR